MKTVAAEPDTGPLVIKGLLPALAIFVAAAAAEYAWGITPTTAEPARPSAAAPS